MQPIRKWNPIRVSIPIENREQGMALLEQIKEAPFEVTGVNRKEGKSFLPVCLTLLLCRWNAIKVWLLGRRNIEVDSGSVREEGGYLSARGYYFSE